MKQIKTLDEVYAELDKESVKITTRYEFIAPKKGIKKPISLTLGKIWLNIITPEDYPLVEQQVDAKKIKNLINDIHSKYDVEISSKFINDINREGYKIAEYFPIAANIDSMIIDNDLKTMKKEMLNSDMNAVEFSKNRVKIGEEYLQKLKNSDSPMYYISQSGAVGDKANTDALSAFFIAKGPSVNIEGAATKPVMNSITDGFSLREFYENASEARSALFTRASGTADPGDLSRDAVFANSNLKINKKDCKTKKYLMQDITEGNVKLFYGRYYEHDGEYILINEKTQKAIIGKTIKLRSPLYCKDDNGICEICYGDLWKKLGTKHVGLIMPAIINAKGQGITMSARHKHSHVKLKEVDFIKNFIK